MHIRRIGRAALAVLAPLIAVLAVTAAPAQATTTRIEAAIGAAGQTYSDVDAASGVDWAADGSSGYSGGAAVENMAVDHWAPDAWMSFSVTVAEGATIAAHGAKLSTGADRTYQVDGGTPITFSNQAATTDLQALFFTTGPLAAGTHVVRINAHGATNSFLRIDYLDVTEPEVTTTTTTTSTTSTTIDASACQWEWGGLQEPDPRPCPAGTEIALSSGSRPASGLGGTEVAGIVLLAGAVGLLLQAGRRRS